MDSTRILFTIIGFDGRETDNIFYGGFAQFASRFNHNLVYAERPCSNYTQYYNFFIQFL